MKIPMKMEERGNLFTYFKKPINPSLRMFCFPYAGGGASVFAQWRDFLPPDIELIAIQFPGRETRISEAPFTDFGILLKQVSNSIQHLTNLPFIFFGHSMGGLITFELVRQLRRDKFPEPVHIFVSGYRAPQLPDLDAPIHNLPDAEFIKELQKLGGTPKDILLHPELVELLIPIIRNDVMLCETYVYREEEPLRCSISAFGGLKDNKLNRSQIEAWNKQTNGAFEMKMFKSDHFFLQENKDSLLREISNKLDHLKNIYFYEKRIDH